MLVNVRVIVERMDQADRKHEELFSVPADLLDKVRKAGGLDTGSGSEVSTIALQLMEAFVKGYKEICHASIDGSGGEGDNRGNSQERGSSGAGGGTARSVLLHEDLGQGEKTGREEAELREKAVLARRLNRLDRGLADD